ncbi:MAG: TlpA disulfide reductase family protein [Pseudomonadota bacterium]
MLKRLACLALALLAVPAPAADLPQPLSAYAGRVVYVDFWASWCAPCAESFPWINTLQAKFGPRLAVVGVNVDENAEDADAFLRRHPANFDIVRDPGGDLAAHYALPGMPTALILGTDGRVLHRHSGFRRDEIPAYEAAIAAALNPSPSTGAR